MNELYVEDFFSSFQIEKGEKPHDLMSKEREETPLPSPSNTFQKLEEMILKECPCLEVVTPYLKEIHKVLEKEKWIEALNLIDELEELLDYSLFSLQ